MKKQILLIPIVLLLALFSCETETFDDDEFDLKASKIEQIGSLFEAIARQPEMADALIKSTENLYSDYNELLPLSDKAVVQRGKARGAAFSMLFKSIARQPDAYNELDAAATKFLGIYNSTDISDELLDITKTYTISVLNESLAMQPEAIGLFNLIAKKYLNFEITQ
jgi:F0F1-type ATP synthase membrane subunit c/vacuolar-type H+-ATPase subunit K